MRSGRWLSVRTASPPARSTELLPKVRFFEFMSSGRRGTLSRERTFDDPGVVALVQGYDEYVMSDSESKEVLFTPGPASARPLDRTAFYRAILPDGRLIGHWRHALEKGKVIIETQFDRPLDAAEKRALEVAAKQYRQFLEMPATLL